MVKYIVISDFDKTMTYPYGNNEKIIPSVISYLREDNKYLGKDYTKKAHEMYNYYNKIESGNYDFTYKSSKMNEWWNKHYELLKEKGLKYEHIKSIVEENDDLRLRKGIKELIKYCSEKNIEYIILSSTGLGKEVIKLLLEKELGKKEINNVKIISNELIWDEEGNFIGVKEPVISKGNKKRIIEEYYPELLQKYDYYILIGDDYEDATLVDKHIERNRTLKIGFPKSSNDAKYYDIVFPFNSEAEEIIKIIKEKFKEF